jgi:cytochrome c-type biogenesis protein CcmH/NrfG
VLTPEILDLGIPAVMGLEIAGVPEELPLPLLSLGDPEPPRHPEILPEKPKVSKTYGKALRMYNLGKLKKAREAFLQCLQEEPETAKAHYYLGIIAAEEKEYKPARDSLLTYLENAPGDTKGLVALERVYKSLQDWPNVLKISEILTSGSQELPPKIHLKVMRDFGVALYFNKDYPRAQKVLDDVEGQDGSTPETYFYLAMAHFHQKNFGWAEENFEKVLKIAPAANQFRPMAESSLKRVREMKKTP